MVQLGRDTEDEIWIQVISFDFSQGNFDEGRSKLSAQLCITKVEMRGSLIAMICD